MSSKLKSFINMFVKRQRKHYSLAWRIIFTVTAVPIIFFGIIVGSAFLLSRNLDKTHGRIEILPYPSNLYFGIAFFAIGLWLFLWVIWAFLVKADGTPAPFVPTHKLVTWGLFAYTRNPMVLGVIFWISGLGIILNSLRFILIGLVLPFLYLIYIKTIEEKELEARFGKEYVEYKKRVPFLIPRIKAR